MKKQKLLKQEKTRLKNALELIQKLQDENASAKKEVEKSWEHCEYLQNKHNREMEVKTNKYNELKERYLKLKDETLLPEANARFVATLINNLNNK